jgi:predicted unusual protein kinase regulating ubiquinone biosynthesis (AarF/ABC1/UbiB family)
LAQVHAACLADGRRVVVKVLRPDIEAVVETDLASFAFGTRWLKLWGRLRQRVDVDWLHREFAAVTRRELDLTAEGRSAERFARDMADESDVLVPAVVWELSGVSVLTMDNVTGLKIGDAAALANAGIDGASLARRLYQIYMRQFFVTHFIHADPHPGNLFVHPAVTPPATDNGPPDGDPTSPAPFKIAFVDFGMTTEVPERLRAALREFAIGLGTRDARRLVMSYVEAGTLLPGADIERLVAAHEAVLDRFWGVPLAELRDVALSEGQALAKEFSDLVFSAPVQLQADMVFSLRAVGLLAGLCSRLDPAFDPWQETIPFARRFARDAAPGLLDGAGQLVRGLVALPTRIERALDRAERGQLTVQSTWSPATTRQIEALTRSIRRLGWLVASGALLISGTLVRVLAPGDPMSLWMLTAAGLCAAFALLRGR